MPVLPYSNSNVPFWRRPSYLVGIFAALCFALLASSCRPPVEPDSNLVRIGLANDVLSLDRARVGDITSWSIIYNVIENLTEIDPATRLPRPALAERWEVSEDRKVLTFKLRRDVRFHNGKVLEAADIKYSIERFLDPKAAAPVRQWLGSVKTVEIVNPYEIRLVLSQPERNILTSLAVVPGIIPEGWEADQSGDPNAVIGTGPFRYRRWQRGQELILDRFPAYWGGEPKVHGVVFRVVPNESSRVMALRRGELDLILSNSLTPASVSDLVEAGFRLQEIPALGQWYLGFDHSTAPFNNRRFRESICASINRESIAKDLLQGRAIQAIGPLPRVFAEHAQDLDSPSFDPSEARRLLADSGVKLDVRKPLELAYGTEWPWVEQLVQVLQADLASAGIPVVARKYEWSTFVSGLFGRKYSFFAVDIFAGNGDPQLFLGDLFGSDSGLNFFNYHNFAFDDSVRKASGLDGEQYRQMIAKTQKILSNDCAAVFLFNPMQGFVMSPRLRGVQPGALQELRLKRAELVAQ